MVISANYKCNSIIASLMLYSSITSLPLHNVTQVSLSWAENLGFHYKKEQTFLKFLLEGIK